MLYIWTTWWTIDKKYGKGKEVYNFEIDEPVVESIICRIAPDIRFSLTKLMRKDSLDMDEKDRKKIADFTSSVEGKNVLLTHGTDTMIETASTIQEALGEFHEKLIVLLWASQPHAIKDSDAEFNVWFWLWVLRSFSQLWVSGIYLCMNGEVFSHNEVEKCDDGVFRRIKK